MAIVSGQHYPDALGSMVAPQNDFRKTRALRKGFVRSDAVGKREVVNDVVNALHPSGVRTHPRYELIILQEVRLQQLGNQWYEYEAEYYWGGRNPDRIGVSGSVTKVKVPWPDEASSGVLWTPNEEPPMQAEVVASLVQISRTRSYTAPSAVKSDIDAFVGTGSAIGAINDAPVTIGTVVYPANHVLFVGFDADYHPTVATTTHTVTLKFLYRRFRYGNTAYGWHTGRYEAIAAPPYWQPAFQVDYPVVTFPGSL